MASIDTFLRARSSLHGTDAVAALLLLDDGRYIMQLRDDIPEIFYPGHWGCFGGAVDQNELPFAALRRELHEELEFDLGVAEEFVRFDFDISRLGPKQKRVYRIYFEVKVSDAEFSRCALHERAEVRAFTGREILSDMRVTPYDAFAVWLHFGRSRFV